LVQGGESNWRERKSTKARILAADAKLQAPDAQPPGKHPAGR
jgi:hypothetical protein